MDWRRVIDPGLSHGIGSGPTIGSLALDELPALYAERRRVTPARLSNRMQREDHVLDEDGVSVRVHTPIDFEVVRGCLVTIHGGGFIVGSNLMDDALLDAWCPELGVLGVSIDYRLAPEAPYPAPFQDCMTAWTWLADNSGHLGIDDLPRGIYGSSAGGALAAAVALRCLDTGGSSPAFLLLDAPCLDDRQPWPSNQWAVPVADHATVELGWRAYLGPLHGTPAVPATAAPARAEDLSRLPPTCITVGAVDGLVGEARDFARRLVAANVPIELQVYPGATHLFAQTHPTSAVARRCRADQARWLADQLTPTGEQRKKLH